MCCCRSGTGSSASELSQSWNQNVGQGHIHLKANQFQVHSCYCWQDLVLCLLVAEVCPQYFPMRNSPLGQLRKWQFASSEPARERAKDREWQQDGNHNILELILDVTFHYFSYYSIHYKQHYIQTTLKRRGLCKSKNTRRQGSLGAILEGCLPPHKWIFLIPFLCNLFI